MELPSDILEMISSAEENIRDAQDLIDQAREEFPTDQAWQFRMDIAQTVLNQKKKNVRVTKKLISDLTQ